MKISTHLHSYAQDGFSLVELMVGLVVGLLVVLAATSGATFYEANRRVGMGGNSALENAMATAYAIQSDARMAGFGSGMTLSNGTTCASIASPASITEGATSQDSDSIAITYYKDLAPATPSCGNTATMTYSVASNTAKCTGGTCAATGDDLAENIVQLKAQYGVNGSGTTVVQKWVKASNLGTNKPIAIRYVVVARGPQKAKLSNGNVCDSSSTSGVPTSSTPGANLASVSANDDSITLDLSATADWKCYSYKTITLTVPLKNVLIQTNNTNTYGS